LSISSIFAGTTPLERIRWTAFPACRTSSKMARIVQRASGRGKSRKVICAITARVPSEPQMS
jgi:hypothetical protein